MLNEQRQQGNAAQRGRGAFGSTHDQGPKAAKFAVLTPEPGMFVNVRNAPRVVIPPPSEMPPVSACEPFVGEVERCDEKRLGNKIYSGSFAGFFSSVGVVGSQRTGKCMYIKAWRNKKEFTGNAKPRCGRGREGPLFRRVSRCVRSFSEIRVCTRFRP